MIEKLKPTIKLFKVLGDESRLKILYILEKAEFTVSELVDMLSIHQSNISRHLQQLREAGLVFDRREGSLVYYRWSENLRNSHELLSVVKSAWKDINDLNLLENHLNSILYQRRTQSQYFFDSVAGRYHSIAEPGGGVEVVLRALGSLVNYQHAVDIGSGEGDISSIISRGCEKVTAIDFNQKMVKVMEERFAQANLDNVSVKQGDIDKLPLDDDCADLVIMSQVLHHAAKPEMALQEMLRILKPGGKYIILDLLAHDQDWVREKMGDQWLGFDPERLAQWLKNLGNKPQSQEIIHINRGLPAIFISGIKT